MHNDEYYMKRALELAEHGRGKVKLNPMVGAVIVHGNQIIGQGFHGEWGGPHAEIEALRDYQRNYPRFSLEKAQLYVNLEPCCHVGKTPPCTLALINSGIGEVMIACLDPNPLVSGKGVEALEQAGIKVRLGLLQKEAEQLNRGFFAQMTKNRPWISLKLATSIDGKLAAADGTSKWISNEKAREEVKALRSMHDAILVGADTYINDSPSFRASKSQPRAFVIDPHNRARSIALQRKDLATAFLPADTSAELCTSGICKDLLDAGINSVLIEGGAKTIRPFLREGLYDTLTLYISPVILGINARDSFDYEMGTSIQDAQHPVCKSIRIIDDNICMVLEPGEAKCLQD